jgi:hypothetical protein
LAPILDCAQVHSVFGHQHFGRPDILDRTVQQIVCHKVPSNRNHSLTKLIRRSGEKVNGHKMAEPSEDERAVQHRHTAETIRQLAGQIRFDHLRRRQLLALADAFDRLADRVTAGPLREAAD